MTEREIKKEIQFERSHIRALLHMREFDDCGQRDAYVIMWDRAIVAARARLRAFRQVTGELEEDAGSDPVKQVRSFYLATDYAPLTACNHVWYYGCRCTKTAGHQGQHECCHKLRWMTTTVEEDVHVGE